ncbi:replication protein [Staphylococcus sp. HMSC072B07]|nr:replication protein [Staphylococcus sp. HMSC072B07]
MTNKTDKSRYFTFILYPESIPKDWQMQLEMIGNSNGD